MAPASLSPQRAFVTPDPGEDWSALAARVLPEEGAGAAVQKLKSWNLHLFARNPPGSFTGSDVIFVEPPREAEEGLFSQAARSRDGGG